MRSRGWVFVHIPNRTTSVANAEHLKRQGLQPGFPDYLVFHPVRVAIEIKRSRDERPRDEQFEWLLRFRGLGWLVLWGTADEVIERLEKV